MKTKLLSLLFILIYVNIFAQQQNGIHEVPTEISEIANTFINYNNDFKVSSNKSKLLNNLNSKITGNSLTDSELNSKIEKIKDKAYNPKMLNMFFANNIASYVTSSKDLSLQKTYAVLDTDEGAFFFGYNINVGAKSKIDNLKHIFNIGAHAKSKDGFVTIYKEKEYSKELGFSARYTYLFGRNINFSRNQRVAMQEHRINYLQKEFAADLAKFKDTITIDTELEAKIEYTKPNDQDRKNEVQETYIKTYEKIATAEEKFLTDNNLYNHISQWWFTIYGYLPITEHEYKISSSITNSNFGTNNVLNYKFAGLLTFMQKWNSSRVLYLTGSASVFNNNNIMSQELKSYDFQTIQSQGGLNQAVESKDNIYVGEFKKGITKSIKLECISFFIKDIIGLSAYVERNYKTFESTNWKLGIPVSLKDKEDKPSVNFELQWKEINKEHILGISIGYIFGKSLK
ncbi:hypothetical protein FMM05_06040 [Flavobacterium zepuense]|uniref:Uncharacterized protein n=1 Tax=Flavobacterium zepuense TaxID=2593302 RepID=A0A552V5R0_9FLAO|nr:hypothetical protein [Flavobacterium zepuense]TRW25781.1 hypothetical protein FMM05_06040 [Flavobacterium zepuense]